MKKKEFLLFALVLLVGIFFRFYLVKQMPGGLFPDEAANGLDVNNIFKGHLQPFYERGNGREALFFYLEALSSWIFGRGVWQFTIVAATIGVLSIVACYFLAKRLYGVKAALLASFLMATSTWHIVLSRTAFRAIMVPLMAGFMFYFLVRFFQAETENDRKWSAIWFGAFFAGGFYTYISFRIVPVILGVLAFFLLMADRKQGFLWWKTYKKYLMHAVIAAFIVFLPLGIYFIGHPKAFVGRSGQVSVFNKDLNQGHLLATIGDVFYKQMRAFFVHGDLNWRQNISGDPFLSILASPFFAGALIVFTLMALRFFWQSLTGKQKMEDLKHVVLITYFWGFMIPVVATAEGIPHGLRGDGVIPAVFIITGFGMIYFARTALKMWHHQWMEYVYAVVAALYLGSIGYLAYASYFGYTYNNVNNSYAFRSDLTTVSNYINDYAKAHPGQKLHTYLVLDLFSLQTVDYFTSSLNNPQINNPYIVVDPANSPKLHPQPGDLIIFTASTLADSLNFAAVNLNSLSGVPNGAPYSRLGETDMIAVKFTGHDKSISMGSNQDGSFIGLNFGDRIDWSWDNLQFNPWEIKIWQCADASCKSQNLVKDNQQSDYLSNHDWVSMDGKKSDLYFHAVGYDKKTGTTIKDYGIIKLQKYIPNK